MPDSPIEPIRCADDGDCVEGYHCLGGRCVIGQGEPPPQQLPGLGRFLRRRYTSNLAVSDEMSANDLLHDVIFKASRSYLTQAYNGKLGLKNKKPAPWALGTDAFAVDDTIIPLDNIADWIDNVDNWLLISPHTIQSEIRTVVDANYSTDQNSIGLSSTGGLFTITGFSGCDGATTPATALIAVTAATANTDCSITLDGTTFTFRTSSADETRETIASYIAGVISSHPALYRRFRVTWASGDQEVGLTALFGDLTLDSGLQFATTAPVADPTVAPTLTAVGSGSLAAGVYAVAYCYVNANGETLLSPYQAVTLTANQNISITAITPPAGTTVKWFVSPEANSVKLRHAASNSGAGFTLSALPKLSAPLPPDLNRTGAEVMRVAAVFSDREETRSAISRSNVIRATFSWLLGNREKSVNQIKLKYRDASQDYRLVELRLRDDAHIAKTKKISPLEVNGQAIDNTDQAYRITAGLLAEKRDADFFYKWSATRTALLLQEGDVVAITDRGSAVYNLPVIIEDIEFDITDGSLPIGSFTARKYASTLYDDSIVERTIDVVAEIDATYLTGGGPMLTGGGDYLTE